MPASRAAAILACAGAIISLSACGGTALLSTTSHSSAPRPVDVQPALRTGSTYLEALNAEQAKLAGAERAIPHHVSSARALARAIALLHDAIARLGTNLSSLHPPRAVAPLHARLVAVARVYADRLGRAARAASRPGQELAAANLLTSATARASHDFTTIAARIADALAR